MNSLGLRSCTFLVLGSLVLACSGRTSSEGKSAMGGAGGTNSAGGSHALAGDSWMGGSRPADAALSAAGTSTFPGTTSSGVTSTGGVIAIGGTSSFGGASPMGGTSATTGTSACRPLMTLCNGTCVLTGTAHDHCGACNKACGPTEVCLGGVCRCPVNDSSADAGSITKYESCVPGQCVDLLSSATHCGTCTNACASKRCIQGACGCAATDILCNKDASCEPTEANCGCFDPLTSSDHCGNCATQCGQYQECAQGLCVLNCAKSNLTQCGNTCVDTLNDSANVAANGSMALNCGACGQVCPSDSFMCSKGTCVCKSSSATRCGDQCVDLQTNVSNCGSCDNACPTAQACVSGRCGCTATSTQCDSGCYDTLSDSNHCGACNTVCGVGEHCSSGICSCAAPLQSCSGHCADYQTEAANCGSCGNACGKGQSCAAGKCPCAAGMDLCSGSCFDLQTDGSHCGSCTTTCSNSQICIAGTCACGSGLIACGPRCVDAQNDAENCGLCGKTCAATQMCQSGACVASILKVQSSAQADSQEYLRVDVSVCNASGNSLSLSGLSLKYWYTEDSASFDPVATIDFAAGLSPAPTVTATLLELSAFREKASSVLQVTFGANTLAANTCTGEVQIRVHAQSGWSCCFSAQSGDYSYSAATTLTDNPNITAYDSQGLLIWGLEPGLLP